MRDLSKHTLVCMTINGEERLVRLCNYLKCMDFTGELLIIDASKEEFAGKFVTYSFVTYISAPGKNWQDSSFIAAGKIKTKYASYIADDDFPLIGGIADCIEQLESDKDAPLCFGKTAWINYTQIKDSVKDSKDLWRYLTCLLEHKLWVDHDVLKSTSADKRVLEMALDYRVIQFSVMRSSLWRKIFTKEFGNLQDTYLTEISSCFAMAIFGGHRKVNSYYLLRGTYHARQSIERYGKGDELSSLDGDIKALYEYFRTLANLDHSLVNALVGACISVRALGLVPRSTGRKDKDKFTQSNALGERVQELLLKEENLKAIHHLAFAD